MVRASGRRRPISAAELVALAAITVAAAGLRFWQLGAIPPGLHVDEAFNQIDARAVAGGWRPIFLPANAGREVLYTYLQAALVGLLGDSIAVLRGASAVAGTLAVPAMWLAARALAPAGVSPPRIGLLAAALLAGTYWHLHFSRFGIRAVLFTPLVCAVVWAWWRTVHAPADRARRSAALAGALLGLAAYVHPAGRGLSALPMAHALWRRAVLRDAAVLGRLAMSFAAMLAVSAPLIWFWAVHPALFFGHAGEVSILGEGPARLAANAARVAGGFLVAGDPAGWRNLPGRPAFDAAVGAAFLLGIALTARAAVGGRDVDGDRDIRGDHGHAGQRGVGGDRDLHGEVDDQAHLDDGAALALFWLAVLLVPSIVTDAAPNFSRAIGALPAACLLAAIGVERAGAWIERRPSRGGRDRDRARAAALGVMLTVPLYAGVRTAVDYFDGWARDPESAIAFDADVRDLAEWALTASDGGAAVFLSPSTASHATVRAVAGQRPHSGVDLTRGLVLRLAAAQGKPGGGGTLRATYAFLDRLPWEAPQITALEARAERYGIALDFEGDIGDDAGLDADADVEAGLDAGLDAEADVEAGPVTEVDAALDAGVDLDDDTGRTLANLSITARDLLAAHPAYSGLSPARDSDPDRDSDSDPGLASDLRSDSDTDLDSGPGSASDSDPGLASEFGPGPDAHRPVGADGAIALEAAHGPLVVRPGEAFDIDLIWSAAGPTRVPLHTAVQLVDASGELMASGDARPLGGAPPTDRWRAGDWIVASHTLEWIDDRGAGLAPGDRLELRIGWYALDPDGAGGWRSVGIPWSSGGDLATVGWLRAGERGSP